MSTLRTSLLFLPLWVCLYLQLFAEPVTVDFEGVAPAGCGDQSVNCGFTFLTTYSEKGLELSKSIEAKALAAIFDSDARDFNGKKFNTNGSDVFGFGHPLTLTLTNGFSFALISLDASNLIKDRGRATLRVVGHLSGGGTLEPVDINPASNTYSTTTFPATWTNLTSVDIINLSIDAMTGVGDCCNAAIDNIVVAKLGFLSYDLQKPKGEPKFEKVEVTLADRFQTDTFTVEKRVSLLNPVDQGYGIIDPETHLVGYKVKQSRLEGEPKPEKMPILGVWIQDDLFPEGLVVDIDNVNKADRLLVPASITEPPPDPLQSHNLDHFLCYKIKLPQGTEFPDIPVTLADPFIDPEGGGVQLFDVGKPKRLCSLVVVDKAPEGDKNPGKSLVCHDLKRPKGSPKHERTTLFLNDPFLSDPFDVAGGWETRKERELCLPAEITLPYP